MIVDDRDAGIFRVNRLSMTSNEVLQLERKRIFDKCWLYLGHESELAGPGEYRRRVIADRPLIFIRGNDGEYRAFYNTCTHRGALICRADQGTAKVFQCFYHAWTFDNKGALIGVPDEAGYGSGFEREEMGLKPVERLAQYRGFYFVAFDPLIEDLVDYLAGAADYLDLVVDQSEEGMRIIPGTNKYAIKANWKLLAENSIDGYHGLPTHETYWQYIADLGVDMSGAMMGGGARSLGNGHAVIQSPAPYGRPIAVWHPLFGEDMKPEIESVRNRIWARHGQERGRMMTNEIRNLLIFPNLIINDVMAITVRQFWPLAPDNMEVTAWELAPKDETAKRLATRLDSFLTFLGPGGFATPDDVEALESCQSGFNADAVAWSDISRGMQRDPKTTDELQMRAFWRRWSSLLQGVPHEDWEATEQKREPEQVASTDGRPGKELTGVSS
ncbi:MAG: Rieske 2Fe-2S domain-containing protein [Dehalococcoidia bacterium]|nr:Rieske 2Fe-2S domain-containing protein [Dehalococcoidia bacterium]